jgi:hypothetical protein
MRTHNASIIILSITLIDTLIIGITLIISNKSHSNTINYFINERITAIKIIVKLIKT